jgi:Galactosyltransferase
MKSLIAVVHCRTRQPYMDAIRSTWLPLAQTDVRFFVGRGDVRDYPEDVVQLDCGDGYEALPEKVRAISRWALEHGYDYMLKCDDDVVLLPNKLLASGYDQYDFVGHRNSSKEDPVPPYGFCYWLSKKSMQIVAQAELPVGNYDEGWVRTKLHQHNILLHHDPRYFLHFGKKEDYVSKRRPLRFSRENTIPSIKPVEGTFAWCMYIPWVGYKNLPVEKNIQEFQKVWNEVKTQN